MTVDPFEGAEDVSEASVFANSPHVDDDDFVLPPTDDAGRGEECGRCKDTGLVPRADGYPIPDVCACPAGEKAAIDMAIG